MSFTPNSHAYSVEHLPAAAKGVLRLQEWPELTRLQPTLVFDAARICALLATRPSVAPLVAVLLDLPLERVVLVVKELRLVDTKNETIEDRPVTEHQSISQLSQAATTAASSLLGRLWQRLSSRGG